MTLDSYLDYRTKKARLELEVEQIKALTQRAGITAEATLQESNLKAKQTKVGQTTTSGL